MSNIPVKNDIAERWLGASFGERSVWIQLFSMVLILGGYFFVAGQMLSVGVAVLPPYAAVFEWRLP